MISLLVRFTVDVIAPLGVSDFVLDALVAVLAVNSSFSEFPANRALPWAADNDDAQAAFRFLSGQKIPLRCLYMT